MKKIKKKLFGEFKKIIVQTKNKKDINRKHNKRVKFKIVEYIVRVNNILIKFWLPINKI